MSAAWRQLQRDIRAHNQALIQYPHQPVLWNFIVAGCNIIVGGAMVTKEYTQSLALFSIAMLLTNQRNPEHDMPRQIRAWRDLYKVGRKEVHEWNEHVVPYFWINIQDDYDALLAAVVHPKDE